MKNYYSDLARLHHAYPPSYDRDVPGLVDDLEEEMSETISTATQTAISTLRSIANGDWREHINPTLAGVVVDHIASLEARNEAMAAVVVAARELRRLPLFNLGRPWGAGSPEYAALAEAQDRLDAALDAQAGEVTG